MQVNSLGNQSYNRIGAAKVRQKEGDFKNFSEILQHSARENEVKQTEDRYVRQTNQAGAGEFSGTYQERLEQIRRLNEQTDWSSMSDVEKVKLFEDRYRAAFDDMDVIDSDLYYDYSPRHQKIKDDYIDGIRKYFDKGGLADLKTPYPDCFRQANYGDMSDDEVRAAIQAKYSNSNSMENKFLMISEYGSNGVSKSGDFIIRATIRLQIFAEVENANKVMLYGTGMKISQHPRFLDMFMSYAKGVGCGDNYKPSWTQVINSAKDMLRPSEGSSGMNSVIGSIRNEMDNFLMEILGRE